MDQTSSIYLAYCVVVAYRNFFCELDMFFFHPIRSKEPSILIFPMLGPAYHFYKMATTARPSCDELGFKILQTRNVVLLCSYREMSGSKTWVI